MRWIVVGSLVWLGLNLCNMLSGVIFVELFVMVGFEVIIFSGFFRILEMINVIKLLVL